MILCLDQHFFLDQWRNVSQEFSCRGWNLSPRRGDAKEFFVENICSVLFAIVLMGSSCIMFF